MPPSKKFEAKRLMDLAIEVMKQSVPESRTDGKASPLVGAMLWMPGGIEDSACRGELREGDHAEFTLLERKHRAANLSGGTLLTTLEPCAPGARNHPKLSCAERIVNARIERVFVGIEDPDPMVDRKGIKYLQDHGVKVELFPRDLQEEIRAANSLFIKQAIERAELARTPQPSAPAVLSALEHACSGARLEDLSTKALEQYRTEVGLDHPSGSSDLNRRLAVQGLLLEENRELVPTGFGMILFGREPRVHLPQAGLLGTIYDTNGRVDVRDFDMPAVLIPKAVMAWIGDKTPNPIDRTEAQRRESNAAFNEILREGIVNALVHRDYAIQGAKCQVRVHPDRVEILSPGQPVAPITVDKLQSFDAPMLSRNPVMHYVFSGMRLAEERGLGLNSMRTRASQASLPRPSFSYNDPYLTLSVYRQGASAVPQDLEHVLSHLSAAERKGLQWIVTTESVSRAEYEHEMNVPSRTAKNHLSKLTSQGLVRKIGSGPATRYEAVR